jgi:phage terminase large subunit
MPLINGEFTQLQISEKIATVLFDNSDGVRYRALYGGRGAGKDWGSYAVLIERAVREPIRVLCTRELQTSIKDSSHRVIADTIARLGYSKYLQVFESEIRGVNGSLFLFRGIRHNTEEIKSMEGVDICVCDEAQSMTKESFIVLDPTIRKAGSEIWFKFNPAYDDDFIYDFCVVNKPHNMVSGEVNYTDNPWCPKELIEQADRMRREDPTLYENVWLGKPKGQGGRIFPMYNSEVHEIDFDLSYLPKCDLYMSIDPHRKYYPAITWYAVTPTSATVVYNEWPKYDDLDMWYDEARDQKQFDKTVKELANIILANDYCLNGGKIIARTGDPRFLAENPDLQVKLMECGVLGWVQAPFERIETQRENLKQLMSYNPAIPLGGCNLPEWYVDKRCKNKTRAYKRHSWSEDKDKESETNKDFIDNDRYFLSTFANGRPIYCERKSVMSIGKLTSGIDVAANTLPIRGYFKNAA